MSPSSAPIVSQAENDSASMSGSDSKKRNKLGYHRTAVACGHCRRRKIRCIPSNDPSETKCQNCIRLKKECQFYPVDQNGSNTRKARSDSRAEPSADEPTLSRASTSSDPDRPTSSVSDSFDVSYGGGTSSSGTWNDAPGMVTSPAGRPESLHAIDQQDWTRSPAHTQLQTQFSQPDSNTTTTAGVYWMQNEGHSAMNYQQQQYGMAVASGPFTQEPQIAYHNGFHQARHNPARQSFSGVSSSGVDHSPNSYRHYNTTFPEIERSMTMPTGIINHDGLSGIVHTSPHLVAGHGQFVYDQPFPHQISNHPQQWFSPTNSQSGFSQHYLPTQQERKYSQYSQMS